MAVAFYFDLGSPYAYLTAERIDAAFDQPVAWRPLSLGGLFKATGRSSWGISDDRAAGMAEIQRRASANGLPAVTWPDRWPGHYLMANRAATFAFRAGRGREFTVQAFRDEFVRGRDLSIPESVLDAAEAVGLGREEVRAGVQDPAVKIALRETTDAALALGVIGVPTIAVDGELFWGDDRVEEAAARCRG